MRRYAVRISPLVGQSSMMRTTWRRAWQTSLAGVCQIPQRMVLDLAAANRPSGMHSS
jgi:hypothetical protein